MRAQPWLPGVRGYVTWESTCIDFTEPRVRGLVASDRRGKRQR